MKPNDLINIYESIPECYMEDWMYMVTRELKNISGREYEIIVTDNKFISHNDGSATIIPINFGIIKKETD